MKYSMLRRVVASLVVLGGVAASMVLFYSVGQVVTARGETSIVGTPREITPIVGTTRAPTPITDGSSSIVPTVGTPREATAYNHDEKIQLLLVAAHTAGLLYCDGVGIYKNKTAERANVRFLTLVFSFGLESELGHNMAYVFRLSMDQPPNVGQIKIDPADGLKKIAPLLITGEAECLVAEAELNEMMKPGGLLDVPAYSATPKVDATR